MWILTSSYNDYDQHGDYFISAWIDKPSSEDLEKICVVNPVEADHILSGGGRQRYEDKWYNLFQIEEGEGVDSD